MIGLLNGVLGFMLRRVVRILVRSLCKAMGCFFGCFRIRDDHSRSHIVSKPTERAVSRNRVSALFLDEEKGESPFKVRESSIPGSSQIEKSLKEEAKFLKACGTIPETPSELRKASNKLRHSPPHGDLESSKFHSWMPHASINRFQTDKQADQPATPTKSCEDRGRKSASLEKTPGSGISDAMVSDSVSVGSTEGSTAVNVFTAAENPSNDATSDSTWPSALNIQDKSKSVHFKFVDTSSSKGSSETVTQDSKHSDSPANQSVSKSLPNPTPLKLSDEVQTPGTVFAANLVTLANQKTRIRSQYVYTVSHPVENVSQWKNELDVEQCTSKEVLGESNESVQRQESATFKAEEQVNQASGDIDFKVEESLSSWLKPRAYTRDNNNQNLQSANKNPHFGRTPGDRPIIGMVATHWNDNEPSQMSHKWWDGKGIPNSTSKYKEDQKVSWHATPFERRLEKALSEESLISQRKHLNGAPIVFDENDESDTALSRLRLSTHSK